ncbi:hypothetical protein LEP1GSC121_1349 [Leptospira borgpetersenii serovar Castellonis str. 200801910]|uniref:Uncharacterized protein n=1 Tax=Leptospira borgpetersenii serovar Ballum TaxID=280505 RepID=A0A0S2IQD6_LEPBO|nr:hypothetical protein LBBP_01410 [Leptospira borgpetersenii serovar Ballum]EKR00397.1 hypothetical protein LEP1GSC121_1349 [Leptospira borgpetersenii serovar Castellonis str. 200801910]EMN56666.1 hypothetical protein LEP1GSC090_0095 [Leptospira borgpetersenii serovar Javanica str. MK146]
MGSQRLPKIFPKTMKSLFLYFDRNSLFLRIHPSFTSVRFTLVSEMIELLRKSE